MNTPPQKPFQILLIGDSCIDEYQYGTVDRISPEAPVPIFKYIHMGSQIESDYHSCYMTNPDMRCPIHDH